MWLLWSHSDAAVKLHVQCLHQLDKCTKGVLEVMYCAKTCDTYINKQVKQEQR